MNLPHPEQLLASAVRYLVDGHEYDAANLLLACSLTVEGLEKSAYGGAISATVSVRGPRAIYDMSAAVSDYWSNRPFYGAERSEEIEALQRTLEQISRSIKAVMPTAINEVVIDYRAQLVELDEDWRNELLQIARGKAVHNQAVEAERVLTWNNHRFRSQAEVRLANALEKAKVLFFPNCKARLGISKRENREPDFLVCHQGKSGILEVDGEPFHPPARTVDDHERDRLFLAHGIKLVQHFDAGECFENAEGVVKKFLYLLGQA